MAARSLDTSQLRHDVEAERQRLGPLEVGLAGEAFVLDGQLARDEAHEFFSRVFWFTMEFGLVWEDGELRTYGAGLLSSYGELDLFRSAEIRPFDIRAMGTQDYDITQYQPLLFAAGSFEELTDQLGAFFTSFDDEQHERLTA